MAKRSSGQFKRMKGDWYPTPLDAVRPLIGHLGSGSFTFAEPCAGDARLAKHIFDLAGDRTYATILSDIEPRSDFVEKKDAFDFECPEGTDYIITNPPWTRQLLHPLIEHFSKQAPTWLLFDADWMHTKQASPYLGYCRKIVSVGRVKWIEDTKNTGKDNASWYLFDQGTIGGTFFYGRG